MSKLYSQSHRALQEKFDTTRMADLMENGLRHQEFTLEEKAFVETQDMFFLSTVDQAGRPTVSYKGGPVGFVRVTEAARLVFPSYDGNGMYYSMGNLMDAPRVGLLFIDFQKPNRLRVHGSAALHFEHPLLSEFPGAEFLVSVDVEDIWVNCPRYIPTYQKVAASKYMPAAGKDAPMAAWKRIDFVQDALPAKDRGKAEQQGGVLSGEDYFTLLAKGEA